MERIPLPQALVDQARAFESGEAVPAEPRHAATVVLLRQGEVGPEVPGASGVEIPGSSGVEIPGSSGVEIYLLRRQTSMAFAGGMCVFPGGGVDPRDHDASVSWAGPSPAEWAERLDCDEALARALVCAAVRETFEESGVLLAGPSDDSVVSDTTGDDWEADRVALETRELSMTDFLVRRGLVLRTDLLGAWSGWLTPVFEPRRYETWFFVAVLPEGQVTRDVSSESSSVHWTPAIAAVEAVEAREILMLPPTYLTCLDVAQHPTPAEVLVEAEARRVEMFTPRVVSAGEDFVLSMPERYRPLVAGR